MAIPAMLVASGAANAVVIGPRTLDFQDHPIITYGKSNTINGPVTSNGILSTNCVEGVCYVKNDVVVSTVFDQTSAGAHLHRGGAPGNRNIHTKGDASGFYIRLTSADSSPFSFSFDSLSIISPFSDLNPHAKFLPDGTPNPDWDSVQDRFHIKGFSAAYNPTLWSDPTPTSLVAEAFVDIGFNGTFDAIAAHAGFANVKAVWIHPVGRHNTALAGLRDFDVRYDNLRITVVPVPAAAWLFGSALMAFAAGAKRRFKLTA
ncbi:MAG: hypothetical protein CTY17_08275 [Methylomonas sp.]|nr:MAG: hypothetical protein CTY17_08275 [Methylomonas sp.]